MQVQLTGAQMERLAKLIAELHYEGDEGVLLTAHSGGIVYAAFNQASYTITASGIAQAEDFG